MKIKYFKYIYGKKTKYLFLFAIALTLISCQKFLDKAPLDTLSQTNFWKTSNDLDLYIRGLYNWLPDQNSFWTDDQSDNMMGGSYVGGYSNYMNGQTVTAITAGSGGWDWSQIEQLISFLIIIKNVRTLLVVISKQ
jgi:hypothetical protein